MPDPITLSVLGTAALSGLVGNRADHLVCSQMKAVWESLRDGQKIPRNGDLARSIRRAQLMALRFGVKAYEDLPLLDRGDNPGYWQEDITTPLLSWIKEALTSKEPPTSDDEQRRRVEARIELAFVHPEPNEAAVARRQEDFRDMALDWTLEEARGFVPRAQDWPRFDSLMRKGGTTNRGTFPGWWPLFRAFLAEEIKYDEKVQRILAEQGIARILELQVDITVAVGALPDWIRENRRQHQRLSR